MLTRTPESVEARALTVAKALESSGLYDCEIVDGRSAIAEAPRRTHAADEATRPHPTGLFRVGPRSGAAPARTPIIARIERDRLVLDLRTVFEDEEAALIHGLRTVA